MSEHDDEYVLVFKSQKHERHNICLWFQQEGLACFNIENAKKFWYQDEAEKYLQTRQADGELFGFEVEKI